MVSDGLRIVVVGARCLGDALMTLPALALLRASLPDARFLLVAPSALAARVWLLSGLAEPSEVREMDGKTHRIPARFFAMRQTRPDGIVLFSGGFVWALAARLAGAPVRVGLASDGRAWLLTHVFPAQAANVHQSVVCRGIASLALAALGNSPAPWQETDYLLPGARDSVREMRRLVVLPSASHGDKIWPAENFAAVMHALLDEGAVSEILVLGSPSERELCQALAAPGGRAGVRAFNAELEELARVCMSAGFALGNTTGLAHLAAFCGCRVLALSGEPGHDRGAPACAGSVSLGNPALPAELQKKGSREVLAAITPEMVLAQLRTMMAEGSPLV